MNDMIEGLPARGAVRARAQDIDRLVGSRMRARRTMLGLTQHEMGELIGVTYQQAHKYEKGVDRIAAGRLFQIAQALDVEIGFFFEDVSEAKESALAPVQRSLLELARNFVAVSDRRHQQAICELARALADRSEPPG
jgi:transcriptional regulator with XRE-family HTH domain